MRQTAINRPAASRQQTSMGMMQFNQVQNKANIVQERVVTKDGMTGMNFKQPTGTRTVIDRPFVVQQLRQKQQAIYYEIESLKKNMEKIGKDNSTYQQLDKKLEELTKEVRESEGKLADYNLAFDKQRAGTRPEEILSIYQHIKGNNDRFRQKLDEIFIERKNQEDQINGIKQQLDEFNEIAQQKINDLLPEQRNEYTSLQEESTNISTQLNSNKTELDEITNQLMYSEKKLRMDANKLKGQMLKDQLTELERKKADLELQLNEANLPFDQARERLMKRIKEDTSLISATEKRIREIKKSTDLYEKKIREMKKPSSEQQNSEEQKKKYEAIFEKDKEFSSFIDEYDSLRNQDLQQLSQIEQSIVSLLAESSQYLAQAGALPSAQAFKKMDNDESVDPLQRLKQEHKTKSEGLRKLEEAELRVEQELKNYKDQISNMQEQIDNKYNRVSQIKSELEQKRRDLIRDRDSFKDRKQKFQDEWKTVKQEHDIKEKKMTLNEMYGRYSEAENKVIALEKDIENLKNFIVTKAQDMDYQSQAQECKIMAHELNKHVCQK